VRSGPVGHRSVDVSLIVLFQAVYYCFACIGRRTSSSMVVGMYGWQTYRYGVAAGRAYICWLLLFQADLYCFRRGRLYRRRSGRRDCYAHPPTGLLLYVNRAVFTISSFSVTALVNDTP